MEILGKIGQLRFSPLAPVRGEGSYLVEEDGRRVLDLSMSGGAASLGYANPVVVAAVSEAAAQMPAVSALLHPNEFATRLGRRLLDTFPDPEDRKVWFGHSGSDANDTALRVATIATGRPRIISFIGSYHGGLTGSMSASGHTSMTHSLPRPGLTLLPYPDMSVSGAGADQVLELLVLHLRTVTPGDQVAAILVEPIMSDGGLIVPPEGFFAGLRERCDRHGIALIVDEVKVGLGRPGFFHAYEEKALCRT